MLRNFGKIVSRTDLKKDINVRRVEFKKIIQANLSNPLAKRYGLEFFTAHGSSSLMHSNAKLLGMHAQQR